MDILQCDAGLFFDCFADDLFCFAIERALAGDEDHLADGNAGAVSAGVGGDAWGDLSFSHWRRGYED